MDDDTQKLIHTINTVKSKINSLASRLEHMIELVIGGYYSQDDQDYKDSSYIIFHDDNELSFHKKIKMLERFLERKFPQFLKDNSDLINRMNRVRKLRNKFAHSINLSNEDHKQFVGKPYFELVYIEEGATKHEQFTWEDIRLRIQDFESLLNSIEILFSELDKDQAKKLKNS